MRHATLRPKQWRCREHRKALHSGLPQGAIALNPANPPGRRPGRRVAQMKFFSILVLLAAGLACSFALIPVSFDYGKQLEESRKSLSNSIWKRYRWNCMWENIPFAIRHSGSIHLFIACETFEGSEQISRIDFESYLYVWAVRMQ